MRSWDFFSLPAFHFQNQRAAGETKKGEAKLCGKLKIKNGLDRVGSNYFQLSRVPDKIMGRRSKIRIEWFASSFSAFPFGLAQGLSLSNGHIQYQRNNNCRLALGEVRAAARSRMKARASSYSCSLPKSEALESISPALIASCYSIRIGIHPRTRRHASAPGV